MPPVIAILGTALTALGGGSLAAGIGTAASLGIAGTEVGLNLSNTIGSGGGSSTPAQPNPTQLAQQVAQQKAQLGSVVNQNAGNIQDATGGGLAPDAIAQLIGSETGNLNNINSLQDILNSQNGGGGGGANPLAFGGGTGTQNPDLSIQTPVMSGAARGLADSGIYGGTS